MILCYHPRDSLQRILEKSGTVNAHREYEKVARERESA